MAHWQSEGYEVVTIARSEKPATGHPIYSQSPEALRQAILTARQSPSDCVVVLGTGAASLVPIAGMLQAGEVPVISSNFCTAWLVEATLTGADELELLRKWLQPSPAWEAPLKYRYPYLFSNAQADMPKSEQCE